MVLLVPFVVSQNTEKCEGTGKRGKTICGGLGCGFKLKDIVDVAIGSHTLSRKKPEALWRIAGAEVAHGYPLAVIT
jgi:hypothetical protein